MAETAKMLSPKKTVCCTSTNAVHIINSFPEDQPIIFAPDINLGRWLKKQTGRENMILWNGSCMVHEIFSHEKITKLQLRHSYRVWYFTPND